VHATALGKAVLALAAPSDVEDVLSGPLEAWTAHTITHRPTLRGQLDAIRDGALAVELREFAPDVSCAAVAVLARGCVPVGALSVSGHADGFAPESLEPQLRAAAVTLAHRMDAVRAAP
jgi:DNA-binding IclR family transcriptional regulator